MLFDLAIFDFDGTLADSRDWFVGTLNQVAERFGFRQVGREEMEALRSCSTREIVRRLEVPAWKLPLIARHMRRRAAEDADQIKLYSGAEEMLTTLKQKNLRLAIVSSNGEEHIRKILGPKLDSMIAAYGCGSSLFGKATKLRKTLWRCGVPPGRAIFIGDETRDIDAARTAGTASGAVLWGYAAEDALRRAKPTLIFGSMDELARL